MLYSNFQNKQLSLLGFGTMRFPTTETGEIDEVRAEEMIDRAIEMGVNYFDTAWPYHSGMSEVVTARILKKYPRESYYLADKYPGHQTAETYDPADIFEKQLRKCDVDYFDFYLLHNINENCIDVYKDKRWGIIDYFIEQKKLGRIRHLGFSTHGGVKMIEEFLSEYGDHMEFCQIQFNYLDDTLQQAGEKYELLTRLGIPVWVMEPVRGGKLARLSDAVEKTMRALRPEESTAAWAFRWLQQYPNVKVILSGMSNMEQVDDNLNTFEKYYPLNGKELALLHGVAEGMKKTVPCTACRYCTDGCPASLDIPYLVSIYNELSSLPSVTASMRLEGLPGEKLPSACVSCGACSQICPQKIDVPKVLSDLQGILDKLPKWADICRERAAAQK
ncbi:MAG: aldo/keto reductase [Clostridia bacterium]|nr:aldo/keto reductase [Clostridia bacterium]